MRASLSASVFLLVYAASAVADSDGSFCVGPSYLAHDVRNADKHVLSILRSMPDGTIATVNVDLPDVQVHRIRCGDRTIEIAGWESLYTVSLESEPPAIRTTTLPRPGDLPKWPVQNLAQWNQEARDTGIAVVDLPWHVPHVLRTEVRPTRTRCVHVVTTTLSRRGSSEPVATLVHREFKSECGE